MSNVMKAALDWAVATMLLAALLTSGVLMGRARAAEAAAFVIPAESGYGIAECLERDKACGTALADAWCQAHDHRRSIAFGAAADVTGATAAGALSPDPGAVLIRCGD